MICSKILGGSNPAIRTLYYRLLRLLSVSVQPLFVFDGPHKPPFKRNKRSGHYGGSLSNVLTKQLLRLFGFPFHIAPGEAEAECALLQREGIVDAVLSEDVDTLMFGCGITLRNWSSEDSRGNHSPTHVSLYDAQVTKNGKSGLDREGMILVALMSGGDYITEGIPGCGIKVASQAARAGFGKSLCQLSRSDAAGLEAWRNKLSHELRTNESKYFRTKHKALEVPDNFPNKEVLGYYTHQVVSSASKIDKLKRDILWDGEIDIPGLRSFVAETFEWTYKMGAKKFIRGLAPALLVHKLRLRGERRASGYGDLILTAMNEMELVRDICGKRTHFSTDGMPELRVIYHPADIVGLDLDAEEDFSEDYGRDGLAPVNDDDQIEGYVSDEPTASSRSVSPSKRAASAYDPTQPESLWILETIAKVGIPLKVEDYEESLRNPRKLIAAKAAAKKAATKGGMAKGAMDKFVKVSKPGVGVAKASKPSSEMLSVSSQPTLPPVYLAPSLERPTSSQSAPALARSTSSKRAPSARSSTRTSTKGTTTDGKATRKPRTRKQAQIEKPKPNTNPWTLAQSSPSSQRLPVTSKPLDQPDKLNRPTASKRSEYIDLCSSLIASPPSSPPVSPTRIPRKHTHSPQLEDDPEAQLPASPFGEENIDLPLTPSSKEKASDKPSPRKKRLSDSPSKITSPKLPQYQRGRTEPLTPQPVNRKLDFLSTSPRARSSSPALPSLEELLSPSSKPHEKDKHSPEISRRALEISETLERFERAVSRIRETSHDRDERDITTIPSSPDVPRSPINMSPRRRKITPKGDSSAVLPEPKAKEKKKEYIMPRDSLPGSWKEVDEHEIKGRRSRAWRLSQIEILDMTAD